MEKEKKKIIIDDSQDLKVRYGRGKKPPASPKPIDWSVMEGEEKKKHDDDPWPPRLH